MTMTHQEYLKLLSNRDYFRIYIFNNGKPRVRYRLKICCDSVRIRDHTKPNGYRCVDLYYYQ